MGVHMKFIVELLTSLTKEQYSHNTEPEYVEDILDSTQIADLSFVEA
jgi:hypothetical protein